MGCQLTRIPGFQWTVEIKYGLQDNKDKVRDDMLQAPGLVWCCGDNNFFLRRILAMPLNFNFFSVTPDKIIMSTFPTFS